MTGTRVIWIKLALIAIVATGAVVGVGTAAKADIPPGWEPGPDSVEYDFGVVGWVHQGHYTGVKGNWHTGVVDVEEDDDGITGWLVDWRCPAGVQPPSPSTDPATQQTACTIKRLRYLEDGGLDRARFNQKRDRLVLRGDYRVVDSPFGNPLGTVPLDMYLQGVGAPAVTSNTSTGTLDYSETWSTARGAGKVDGHGLGGHGTQQLFARVSFYVESWVPSS